MIAGIKALLKALISTQDHNGETAMVTDEKIYPHLFLINYRDHSTAYREYDSLQEAHLEIEEMKSEEEIAYLRARFSDGTEISWENTASDGHETAQAVNPTTSTQPKYPYLFLIDHKDLSTQYQEYDTLREAKFTIDELKQDNEIACFRARYPDGTETLWQNPNQEEE